MVKDNGLFRKVLSGIGVSALVGMMACSGVKGESSSDSVMVQSETAGRECSLTGQWLIENVEVNDSVYVRPSEIGEGVTSYIDFREDNTFGIMTNCNHIGGNYHLSGDSISFSDMSCTEMACDNMELEEILKKVLPQIRAVDCLNDSLTRLNAANAEAYIVLKKSPIPVK